MKYKSTPPVREEKQSDLFQRMGDLAEKEAQFAQLRNAQEKLFARMELSPEMKFDDDALKLVRDRARNEHSVDSFEKKAAEIYISFFLIHQGWEMWHDRAEKIEGEFLKALNEEKK